MAAQHLDIFLVLNFVLGELEKLQVVDKGALVLLGFDPLLHRITISHLCCLFLGFRFLTSNTWRIVNALLLDALVLVVTIEHEGRAVAVTYIAVMGSNLHFLLFSGTVLLQIDLERHVSRGHDFGLPNRIVVTSQLDRLVGFML